MNSLLNHALAFTFFSANIFSGNHFPQTQLLAHHAMPLNDRYAVKSVNRVFKDNILLTIDYMNNTVHNASEIKWDSVEKPFHYEFSLEPHQTFAFHDSILPDYKDTLSKTTNAHFDGSEGFQSDGYLFGDGVCHLASLINWVARDAKLGVTTPTNHDFANIPDIPKEYGVAIYDQKGEDAASEQQNLYITNNHENPVTFAFDYQNDILQVSITEIEK